MFSIWSMTGLPTLRLLDRKAIAQARSVTGLPKILVVRQLLSRHHTAIQGFALANHHLNEELQVSTVQRHRKQMCSRQGVLA